MNKYCIKGLVFFLLVFTGDFLYAESVWDAPTPVVSNLPKMTVYRSPTCGCCGKWIDHMEKHGFDIIDIKTDDIATIKRQLGMPEQFGSCHTALVDGYIIEGHVPAGDVKKLLSERPHVVGLSVPAMPVGTPGMEMGGKKQPFTVISFDGDEKQETFTEYLFY